MIGELFCDGGSILAKRRFGGSSFQIIELLKPLEVAGFSDTSFQCLELVANPCEVRHFAGLSDGRHPIDCTARFDRALPMNLAHARTISIS